MDLKTILPFLLGGLPGFDTNKNKAPEWLQKVNDTVGPGAALTIAKMPLGLLNNAGTATQPAAAQPSWLTPLHVGNQFKQNEMISGVGNEGEHMNSRRAMLMKILMGGAPDAASSLGAMGY